MPFIQRERFDTLRNASKNGDALAQKILEAFRSDDSNFESMLNEYFAPAPKPEETSEPEVEISGEPKSKLEVFLSDNNVTKDSPEYQDFVDEFYNMFPEEKDTTKQDPDILDPEAPKVAGFQPDRTGLAELMDASNELVMKYDKMILSITNNPDLTETLKVGSVGKLQKIKEDLLEHIKGLQEMGKSIVDKVQ